MDRRNFFSISAPSSVTSPPVSPVLTPLSISAGLDYPGVGPEHSLLKDIGRAKYVGATDDEVLETFLWLTRE